MRHIDFSLLTRYGTVLIYINGPFKESQQNLIRISV